MCEPMTIIAGVGLAVTAASAAYGVKTSMDNQKAQNNAAEYQAKILERNAQVAEINAGYVEKQGKIDEKQHRLMVSSAIGTQRATGAGSGALVGDGSNLDLTQDTAGFGEIDALTIRRNASVDAWKVRNQVVDLESQAALSRAKKGSVGSAAGGSLLTGASNLTASAGNFAQSYKSEFRN